MIKDRIKAILDAGFEARVSLKKSGLTKADIKPLADQGDLDAQLVLLLGLSCNDLKTWTEEFEDEDTHEIILIERFSYLDSPLFSAEPGEVDALSKAIAATIPSQTIDTLKKWASLFDRDALYPTLHEELARKGDADGLARIGSFYADGFESAGYKKDKDKAREYFDKALSAGWEKSEYDRNIEMLDYSPLEHPEDFADDFDPRYATIRISGHPTELGRIEALIDKLTASHGDPGNELGLFVPLKSLFEALGFKWVDNTGNLMHINRLSENVLTLEIECNPRVDEALVEAFQKAYPKLTVETSNYY